MATTILPTLPSLLHSFFHEWLAEQRNASRRTVQAYRDAWRLFLRFVAARHHKTVAVLRLEDLVGAEVLTFLQHIEQERKATIRTRNCRLAAIRSFFLFVPDREPLPAKQCADVLRVPFKKAPKRALCGSAREFEKPPIGGDLSVLPFPGDAGFRIPALAADLRLPPTESSASSEDLNTGIRGLFGGGRRA